jgi:hypothetical protein
MKPLLLTKQAEEIYNKMQEAIQKQEKEREELLQKIKQESESVKK